TAVMIGRPYIYGLAAAGAAGVAHVLHSLRAELEVAMALTGCSTLADIGPELLYRSCSGAACGLGSSSCSGKVSLGQPCSRFTLSQSKNGPGSVLRPGAICS